MSPAGYNTEGCRLGSVQCQATLRAETLCKKFESREDKEGLFEGGCIFDLLFLYFLSSMGRVGYNTERSCLGSVQRQATLRAEPIRLNLGKIKKVYL